MDTKKNPILIVEDDAGILELLIEQIESCGFNTVGIQNASDAIKWLKKNIPFLMVLDYQLPDMNSKELIHQLQIEKINIAPFVVSTGQGDEHVAVEMMKLGALDYIVKDNQFLEMIPIVVKHLIDEIEKDLRLKKSELELLELSQFNHQIIQSAQEGILVFDKDLNFLIFNPYMENLTGVKSSELIGKNMLEAFPFLKDTKILQNRKNSLKGEIKKNAEVEYNFNISTTNRKGWVLETSAPLYNANKEIIGGISIVRDITEMKLAAEALQVSETRYHKFINSTPDLVFIKDEKFKFIVANDQLCKYYNKSEEEILGKTVFELIKESYANSCQASDSDAIKTNGIVYMEEKQGDLFFETLKFPIEYQKGKIGVGGFIKNITDRKTAELALKEKMDEMTRFHKMVVGRELAMVELKKEINEMLKVAGKEEKYRVIE